MVVRVPAAVLVVLSLSAPPLVGIICGLVCTSEHHEPLQAAQHHHQHAAAGARHDEAAPVQMVGRHVCDHGLGVVDAYSPSNGWRSPLLSTVTLAAATQAQLVPTPVTASWSQPLERVLGPPTRSPVLRI